MKRIPSRGQIKTLSESLGVSPRTLNNWSKLTGPTKEGRPRYSAEQRKTALFRVARELKRSGLAGEAALAKELPDVPLRLVREYLAAIKKRRRKRALEKATTKRKSVEVLASNVIWCQDGTHLGRTSDDTALEAQVIKDRGSVLLLDAEVGAAADALEIIDQLEAMNKKRGLPLVWSTDNGAAYVSEEVLKYLEHEKVIHLRSLPRTPQHNGAIERAMREIKDASGLGKGCKLSGKESTNECLQRAVHKINNNVCRISKENKCAAVLDSVLPSAYNLVNRNYFYAECKKAMCEARLGTMNKRDGRMAERNAIYSVLEKNGLVKCLTGGKPRTRHATKLEIKL